MKVNCHDVIVRLIKYFDNEQEDGYPIQQNLEEKKMNEDREFLNDGFRTDP